MPGNVTLTLDAGAIARVTGDACEKSAYKAAQRVRGKAMANVRRSGRINTGKMMNYTQVRLESSKDRVVYTVQSTVPYAVFQEYGTRAHGPVRARFLVFRIRGKGPLIFAKWVRGVTPGNFLRDAIRDTRASDFGA